MSMSSEQFPLPPEFPSSDQDQPRQQAELPANSLSPAEPVGASEPEIIANSDGDSASDSADVQSNLAAALVRSQPIPPPSEPMQYRAIGLVQGRYIASADQFTQGILLTSDGTVIDAVLLGRIMSLVKNHLNIEQEHLWVVYPRTRQKDGNLHTQIVGVWEPENLMPAYEPPTTEVPLPVADGYFSIRGEVIFQSQEQQYIIVKIRQAPRKESDEPKFFKLKLNGTLQAKAVGDFWDLSVQRQSNTLVIQEGKNIGPMPWKKKPAKPRKGGRPGGKPFRSNQPYPGPGSQSPPRKGPPPAPVTPPIRREPISKPVVKRRPQQDAPPEGGKGKTEE